MHMKKGAVLINTARAEVIDEIALWNKMETDINFTYGADVAPTNSDKWLLEFKNRVFFTQVKCGAQTEESNINC